MRRSWRKFLGTAGKVILAVALLSVIAAQTEPADVLEVWQHASMPWLAATVVAFTSSIVLMARRSWHLIGRRAAFPSVLSAVMIQTIVGNLIATSAGVISYVALLRGRDQVDLHIGVSSLVASKVGDALALGGVLVTASVLAWSQIEVIRPPVLSLNVALGAALCCVLGLLLARRRVVAAISKVLRVTGLIRIGKFHEIEAILLRYVEQPLSMRDIARTLGYSVVIWLSMLTYAYCSYRVFSFETSAAALLLAVTLTQLMGIFPIQVFGGLGVYDITYVYVFGLFGHDYDVSVAVVLAIRVLFYLINALLVAYFPAAMLVDRFRRRRTIICKGERTRI